MGNPKALAVPLPRLVSRRDFRHDPVTALIKWIDSSGERISQSSRSTDVGSGKWEGHPILFLRLAQGGL
jgi:hypothetical protein